MISSTTDSTSARLGYAHPHNLASADIPQDRPSNQEDNFHSGEEYDEEDIARSNCNRVFYPHPRVCLTYWDESLRNRMCENVKELIDIVSEKETKASPTQARLAKKALAYRRISSRLPEVDPNDPSFDVSAFLGVEWRKAPTASRCG